MLNQTRIGFIGTGLMGAPMARRLLKACFPVVVWNRSSSKSEALCRLGATVADSPREVAISSDVVCVCVTDTDAVSTVVFGANGVASGATRDSVLVDLSSIKPDATRSMAERLHQAVGMHWVDAPVSGGVKGAEDGTLIIMCGGENEVVERIAPVFEALSSKFSHMGSTGAGQVTKLCNQVIVATNLLAISESLLLAKAAGVRLDRLPDALSGGWADSLPLQIIGPHIVAGKSEIKIGGLAMMLKDIDSALKMAGDHREAMRITSEVARTYRDAIGDDREDKNLSSLGAFYGISQND